MSDLFGHVHPMNVPHPIFARAACQPHPEPLSRETIESLLHFLRSDSHPEHEALRSYLIAQNEKALAILGRRAAVA